MFGNNSSSKKLFNVIEPNKCIIEDLEVLAFESEEQLNYYTIWHEALVDKRRESNAESDRERQIIRNEIARKTKQLIGSVSSNEGGRNSKKATANSNGSSSRSSPLKSSSRRVLQPPTPSTPPSQPSSATIQSSPTRRAPSSITTPALAASRRAVAAAVAFRSTPLTPRSNQSVAAQSAASHLRQGSASLPNGLTILNSSHFNTMPNGKLMMKYKLTKLYNKYRGRQMRRNFVNDKQKNAKIEVEIGKSYLNSWLAYTALQALRLPDNNMNSLNTTTNNSSKILTPMIQPTTSIGAPFAPSPKKARTPSKKPKQQQQHQQQQQFKPTTPLNMAQKPPMHLVYIDPGNIITYSNRINPQQVAEYRQKSHLLPSSATSKKSSAASYDVYEIMEVLANTTKTNVTITRNANRPSQSGSTTSIYSHSVNSNTPGIVSTQLHLQARSYLDSMSKFYDEEVQRLEKANEEMKREPPHEDLVNRYLKIDHTYSTKNTTTNTSTRSRNDLNSYENSYTDDDQRDLNSEQEDELEDLEEDILTMLKSKDKDNVSANRDLNMSIPQIL